MDRVYYIYRHIRLDKNEVFYIGLGKKEKGYKGPGREYYRANNPRKRSDFWNNIVSKSGYEVEIMLDDLTIYEAREKEKEFIKLYGRRELGTGTLCNLTDGGEGTVGYKPTKETIKKLIDARKGYKHSPATINKMKATSLTINKNTTGKKVKCLKSGTIYNSVVEACRKLNYNPNTEHKKVREGTSELLEKIS